MAAALRLPDWRKWLRSAKADRAPAILTRRHIYILPTRYGALYAVILIGMLIGSINYTLSLGFILTFLLAGMGNIAMLHTWRNLANLHIRHYRAASVFAGEEAIFEMMVAEHQLRPRYAIAAHFDDEAPAYIDIPAGGESMIKIATRTKKRGWLKAGRVTFFTEFPLGLFHAWSYVSVDMRCLVYPHPAVQSAPIPNSADMGATGSLDHTSGDDDFAGHRNYQLGDSPRRVDWKASSREQGLITKLFQGEGQSTLWLDWDQTPGSDGEQRVRQLTRWVVDAQSEHKSYGLRLPGLSINPGNSEGHYHRCLEALALLELP
jgi:uncharacterized protein (DUF58 family)